MDVKNPHGRKGLIHKEPAELVESTLEKEEEIKKYFEGVDSLRMKDSEKYTIKSHGDKIEQLGWPIFGKDKFPNYEIFWQDFVTPITNRSSDINDLHYNSGSTIEEREISSIHYAIFHNFYFIYSGLNSRINREFFDFSFIKLANTCDLVEEFLLKLMIFRNQIDSKNEIIIKSISELKMPKLSPEQALKELCKRGSYAIPVIDRLTILKNYFDLEEYAKLSSSIRHYRNIIAHSWQSFQVDDKVPRVEYVKEYKDWLKVTNVVKSKNENVRNKMINDHFIEMSELIKSETNRLIEIINKLWEEVIDRPDNKKPGEHLDKVFRNGSGVSILTTTSGTCTISPTFSSGIISRNNYKK